MATTLLTRKTRVWVPAYRIAPEHQALFIRCYTARDKQARFYVVKSKNRINYAPEMIVTKIFDPKKDAYLCAPAVLFVDCYRHHVATLAEDGYIELANACYALDGAVKDAREFNYVPNPKRQAKQRQRTNVMIRSHGYELGDLVGRFSLPGQIWRIVGGSQTSADIEPAFCLNNDDMGIRRTITTNWENIKKIDLVKLGMDFMKFQMFLRAEVRRKSGD